jgi:DNA-binding transcriptional ArsR family regulator
MELPWKAISDDSRRQILLLLKEKDMTPTEIAQYFKFTFPALSSHLRILKSSDLIRERKIGKNRIYSLNREKTLEMMKFFAGMWEYNLSSLKELLENEQKNE